MTRRSLKRQRGQERKADKVFNKLTDAHREAEYLNTIELAQTQIGNTQRDIRMQKSQSRRVGQYPQCLPYTTNQIETVQDQIVLVIPFFLYGILLNPRGWRDFHLMLHDQYLEDPADGTVRPNLVIITSTEEERLHLVEDRYDRSDILENILSNPARLRELAQALNLNEMPQTHTEIIAALCEDERRHFNRNLGWRDVTFVEVEDPNLIKNEMMVIVDGAEVITSSVDPTLPLQDHANQTVSEIGGRRLKNAQRKIKKILPQHFENKETILDKLDKLIKKTYYPEQLESQAAPTLRRRFTNWVINGL